MMTGETNSTEKKMDWVEVSNFCTVESDTYTEYGLNEGDMVYVCGDGFVPENEDDPYLLRKIYFVAFMEDDHVQVKEKPLLVKGNYLKAVGEERQKELEAVFIEDHKPTEVVEVEVVEEEAPQLAS